MIDTNTKFHGKPLLLKDFLCFLGDGRVCKRQQIRHRLKNFDIGSELLPNTADFQSDDARSDNAEGGRNFFQRESSAVGKNAVFIKGNVRQGTRLASGCKNHALSHDFRLCRRVDVNQIPVRVCSRERSSAVKEGDLILLEKIQNTVIGLTNNLILTGHHLGNIDRGTIHFDSVLTRFKLNLFKKRGRRQQRFRRNAADIGACAPGRGFTFLHPVINAANGESELRGSDRRNIAAGTGADDNDIKNLNIFSH